MTTPVFALIGAVNHGKSSIAATLVEDDRIGISGDPGKTMESQRFDSRTGGLTVWDTPGFQDPRGMLAEIQAAARASSQPLEVYREFATRHTSSGLFGAERELLRPLFYGAAILYVIDTSREYKRIHEAEMEILRLTGLPRLAILNPTGPAAHDSVWRAKLGQQFGVVHEFNAHAARMEHRAELLRTMATVAGEWRGPLIAAAAKVVSGWKSRMEDAAQVMVELVGKSVTHTRQASLAPGDDKQAAIRSLTKGFHDDLRREEKEAHGKLRDLFCHRQVVITSHDALAITDDLFGDETWNLFGLPWQALLAGGMVGGGVIGAKSGAMAGAWGELAAPTGISTAIGTAIGGTLGAAIGGFTAVTIGKSVAQPSVKEEPDDMIGSVVAGMRRKTAGVIYGTGTRITVGPLKGDNFPYILLDRATAVVCYLADRTHARRDVARIDPAGLKGGLDRAKASTQHWPEGLRDACRKYLRNAGKSAAAHNEKSFRSELAAHLEAATRQPFVIGTPLR